ncbi:MAG: CHAT domain-containing protein [Cyanothece sp. SIO1E1]|nr:CHAT domain-containing protein [Cyanothece sp. SIO1E1]
MLNSRCKHLYRIKSKYQSLSLLLCVCIVNGAKTTALAEAIIAAPDSIGTEVSVDGDRFTINGGTQAGDNLFQSFQQFGLSPGQIANFIAQPDIQNILGRVIGDVPSVIDGQIQVTGANANLFLLNPAGIVFGTNASLDIPASFNATTAHGIQFEAGLFGLSNNREQIQTLVGFPTGLRFTTPEAGAIVNAGNLGVSAGESLSLIGGIVINTGALSAPGGQITLAAVPGEQFVRLGQPGNILSFDLPAASSSLNNEATPSITPLTLPQMLTGGDLNNATQLVLKDGTVRLINSDTTIPTETGTVIASGQISVATPEISLNQSMPSISILGHTVGVIEGDLNASGANGGGTVLIGGDLSQSNIPTANVTTVDQASTIRADALDQGDGGRVMILAEDTAQFDGAITVRGGNRSGNGGFVETSGKQSLQIGSTARVDTTAVQGQIGTWLLDPDNLAIADNGGDVTPATIVANLQTTDQILNATILITIADEIDASDNSAPPGIGNLMLDAPTIDLNAPIELQSGRILSGTAATVNVGASGSVQNGVDVAATNGTVNLAAATFREESEVTITNSITLRGAGASQTIVSGDIDDDGISDHRIFNIMGGNVALDSLTIRDGQADNGGGINNAADLTITNSTLSNNTASMNGGGIINSGTLTITNSTFSNNVAGNDGGGIENTNMLTVNDSSFINNTGGVDGGGIENSGTLIVTNSTFANNNAIANDGGGIDNDSILTVSNSTFTNNTAGTAGGGIASSGGTANISNTIIAGNSTGSLGPDVFSGGFVDAGNNLIGISNGSSSFTNSLLVGTSANPIDPRLAPLANNGGPTQTQALLADSPALDAGNPSITTPDQRGLARNGIPDIGAFERGTPNSLTIVAGDNQSTIVNTPFGNSLQVQVTDTFGSVLDGINVSFTAPGSGASGMPTNTTVMTDTAGLATTTFTANTVAGNFTVDASLGSLMTSFNLANVPDIPANLVITAGDGQSTTVNTDFANRLIVGVQDQFANLVPGATVTFQAPANSLNAPTGSFNGSDTASFTTGSSGTARAPVLTANTVAGNFIVDANLGSLSTSFNLANVPDIPANLVITAGDGQSTTVNTDFANNLTVQVQDQFANLVPGATVTFQAPANIPNAPTGGFNGSDTASFTTGSSGTAQAPVLTANTVAGNFTVDANLGSLTTSFDLTNVPDIPANLVITAGDNQSTTVNTDFANNLTVQVQDQFANLVPGATVTFQAPANIPNAPTGSFNGSDTASFTTGSSGTAQAPVLTANTVAGNFTVDANLGSLTTSFDLTNLPDIPANLVITAGDNQSTTVNTDFASNLTVQVEDQFANLVPGATVTFQAPGDTIDTPTGTFDGSATTASITTDASGIAIAPILSANTIAGNFVVDAVVENASDNFSLTNLPDIPDNLSLIGGDAQETVINTEFANALTVQVADPFGNPTPNVAVTFLAPINGASGLFPVGNTAITDQNGITSVSIAANDIAGFFNVTASVEKLDSVSFGLTNFVIPADAPLLVPAFSPSDIELPDLAGLLGEISQLDLPTFGLDEAILLGLLSDKAEATILEAELPVIGNSTQLANAALEALDASFSQDFDEFFGDLEITRMSASDLSRLLQQIEQARGIRSAVVYAVFTPSESNRLGETPSAENSVAIAPLSNLRRAEQPRASDRLELILVSPGGLPIRYVTPTTRAQVTRQAKFLRMTVSDPEDERSFKPIARQFYGWLLEPLEANLREQDITHLIYSLDQGLRTIPLAALMDPAGFVIERYSLAVIPSVGLTNQSLTPLDTSKTIAVGADQFEHLEALPAVPTELQVVKQHLDTDKLLFNEDFTLTNLHNIQKQQSPSILHLATHARFNQGSPKASFIQFWDARLTLDQVKLLNLDQSLELLILSACTTALDSSAAELGFAGLAAATGVRASIGSLWNVSDIGTLALMSELYAQLKTAPSLGEAMRQAQLALLSGQVRIDGGKLLMSQGAVTLPMELRSPATIPFIHPFYWSAFTLVGNPW